MEEVETLLKEAEAARDGGDLTLARLLYEKVLTREPLQEFALLGLGVCDRREGRPDNALALHQRAQVAHPESVWPHLELAFDLFMLGRFNECEAELLIVQARRPADLNALQGLIAIDKHRGEFTRALARLDAAPDELKRSEAMILERIGLLDLLERRGEVWRLLAEGAARYPSNPNFLMEMARLRALEGDRKGAITALEAATLCTPDHPAPWLRLSDLARQEQRPDVALKQLEIAKTTCRPDIWVDLGMAQTLFELGRYPDCEAVLRQAYEVHQGHHLVTQVHAEFIAKLGRPGDALTLVRQAIETAPQAESLLVLLGELCQKLGQTEQAARIAAELTTKLDTDPHTRTRWLQLTARLAEDNFQRGDARKLYVTLEQHQPESRLALEGQIRLALLSGDLTLSHEKLMKLAQLEMPGRLARGLPANISQSFWGQYHEEYAFNPDLVAELAKLDALPAASRIKSLMELANNYPDWTPVACALLLALREAGLFGYSIAPSKARSVIPPRIFQYWHSPTPPSDVATLMASWPTLNPDCSYQLFDDASARLWLREHDTRALEAYLAARHSTQKCDVFRLALLYHEGGWYADADDRALSSLTDSPVAGADFVTYQEEFATLGNNLLAARAGHPIIGAALNDAITALIRGDSDIVWLSTGPGMLSRAFVKTLVAKGSGWPGLIKDMSIMAKSQLNRLVAVHCHAQYKLSDAHWANNQLQKAKIRTPALEPSSE